MRTTRFVRRSTSPIRLRMYGYYLYRRLPMLDFLRNSYFYMINGRAERQYRHQAYPGDIGLFRDLGPYADPNMGWGRFVRGRIDSYEMPIDASDARAIMREPAVGAVAEEIERYLSRKAGPRAAGEPMMESRLRSSAS